MSRKHKHTVEAVLVGTSNAPIILEVDSTEDLQMQHRAEDGGAALAPVQGSTSTGPSQPTDPEKDTVGSKTEPGMRLYEALFQSVYLHRAARTFSPGVVLLSDGNRFWTADETTFEPTLVVGMIIDSGKERTEPIWRPVVGDLKGWRMA